jgi:hypothetical protein
MGSGQPWEDPDPAFLEFAGAVEEDEWGAVSGLEDRCSNSGKIDGLFRDVESFE